MPTNTDKLTAIRIKQQNGQYGPQIPVGAKAENVKYDNMYSVKEVLGNVRTNVGSLQEQIDNIDTETIAETVDAWMDEHADPGTVVVLDDTLTESTMAANAAAAGKLIIINNQTSGDSTKVKFDTTNQIVQVLTTDDIDPNDLNTLAEDFAATYVPNQAYSAGDYCTYQYQLYRCKADIPENTDATFVTSHWQVVKLANTLNDEVGDLKTQLDVAMDGIEDEGAESSGNIITVDSANGSVDYISVDASGAETSVITRCGRNIYPKYSSGSSSGLSWTVDDDGEIEFTGTPTANVLLRHQNLSVPCTGKAFVLAANNTMAGTSNQLAIICKNPVGNWQTNITSVNTIATHAVYQSQDAKFTEFQIKLVKDIDWTGLKMKPMLVVGDTLGDYEAYTGQAYNVTLVNGVVQDNIPLLDGVNTLWASNGSITVKFRDTVNSIKNYVDAQINNTNESFYRFYVSGGARYLYVYYKSGDKYVRWQLHNVPAQASNSNTWQIGRVCGVDDVDDSGLVEIVRGGEFELAFKENGAEDYCGGNNHGDENTDTFILHIDGKQIVDLTTLPTSPTPFNRIDAFEIATVNRCNTPSENILKHQKIWIFEDGKVKIRQTIKYLEQLIVDTALVCMFAALRSAYSYGIRKGGVTIEDMTTNGYTKVYTTADDVFYEYYGENATAKIHAKTDNPDNASKVWINPTVDLNKLYYGYYGLTDSGHPTTVPANSIITAESEYDVAYTPQ